MPEMRFARIDFGSDPNIGLYGWATDSYCLVGAEPSAKLKDRMEKVLGVEVRRSFIAGTELAAIFAAGNSNGMVLSKLVEKHELAALKRAFTDMNFMILPSKETAVGNMILCNDRAALVSRRLKKHAKKISDCLGVPVEAGELAGMEVVGSAALATNRGCLCSPMVKEEELKRLEEILKVRVDVGTANFGSPFVKAGLIVNSSGLLASELSTGPELGRAMEVFGYE
ncbi:MAG: translation initiation factor IF-6 [Candidatus Aenigmatarchaeota archaeon]